MSKIIDIIDKDSHANLNQYNKNVLDTPSIVFIENKVKSNLSRIINLKTGSNPRILFALKPLTFLGFLRFVPRYLDGFAASSLFEATLARELIGDGGIVNFTTPGLRPSEVDQIFGLCDYVSFNSLNQVAWYLNPTIQKIKYGLRVNPGISFVKDQRYNPSREASKLGVPLAQLVSALSNGAHTQLEHISGLHFHNNCDSTDLSQLLKTVKQIELHISDFLSKLEWINLGGGYIFQEAASLDPLYEAVDLLQKKYALEVFIEPGAAIVRDAGYIVSSVLDIFESDGKTIAVLDTTVNHMPEVFEYQYEPDVIGHVEGGKYKYILAGCSCLAGDVFGEYTFNEPLEVGSRVVFSGMGAYTLVKANMFNGINLPTIYSLREDGELVLEKQFTYEDFASRCGVETHDLA
ncbi:MAG: hypothetical protein FVQ79_12885 [Planctomycetes bacterium]|nr:hypothetical protein [Planctomycetota bacterium]